VPERLKHVVALLPGPERSRRLLAAGGAVAGVALITGVVVGAGLPGSSKGASKVHVSGAATVARRDLVSTDTESGTLGYANPQTVYNRVSGTITWLPAVGRQIKPGGTLYRVDNAPIVLFDGTTPAYRTLEAGISDGPDIGELNRNLVALGYDPSHEITVNDTWQTGTTDAINRWQSALGETQTGVITLGQVVFLPGPQLVTTVETVLGSTGGSGSSGSSGSGSGSSGSGSGTGASYVSSGSRTEFVSLTSTKRMVPSGPTGPTGPTGPGKHPNGNGSTPGLQALTALLKAETAELRARGSSSGGSAGSLSGGGSSRGGGSLSAGGGGGSGGGSSAGASGAGSSGATAGVPILQTTSTQEVVTVQLDATKQTEAVLGEPVTVQLPDGSTVNGKITQVSPVAQSSSSSSSGSGGSGSGSGGSGSGSGSPSATIPVTITLTGRSHVSGLDQAAVSVNFAQQKANNVLSVPVTALIATQGGGYAVQEAATPHTLIPVTPGLFAAGYVQISGSGVYPGLQVTDSQG
jgi:Putative peptidoglycan binding domain